MAGGQRLISRLHSYSTSSVALNMRTYTHGHSWAIQIRPIVITSNFSEKQSGLSFTPVKRTNLPENEAPQRPQFD
jgi:hypothetical protein